VQTSTSTNGWTLAPIFGPAPRRCLYETTGSTCTDTIIAGS
jgi:hypothetical protein